MIELLLFWICCLAALSGAIGAATVSNLFHAALLLGLSLLGVAGLYLFLEAYYVACIQVVVYIGGVLVLILFATLFSADVMGTLQRASWGLRAAGLAGAAVAAAVAVQLAQIAVLHAPHLGHVRSTPGARPDPLAGAGAGERSAAATTIGDLLTGSWFVPFLLAGILLTVALVGAVATVKRFRRPLQVRGG